MIRPVSPAEYPAALKVIGDAFGLVVRPPTVHTVVAEDPDGHFPVAERDGAIVGWAALSPASARHCYRGVGEVSVYVAGEARGDGLGRTLLDELVERSEGAGYWTLTAGVFPENEASLRLHKACGFREVGVRERIGEAGGVWRDVVLLERRSRLVG